MSAKASKADKTFLKAANQFVADMKKFVVRGHRIWSVDSAYLLIFTSEGIWLRIYLTVPIHEYSSLMERLENSMASLKLPLKLEVVGKSKRSDIQLEEAISIVKMFNNISEYHPIDTSVDGIDGKWVEDIFSNLSIVRPNVSSVRDFSIVTMDLEDSGYVRNSRFVQYGFQQVPNSGIWVNVIAQMLG